ncbi:hypothetical protein ACXR0O_09770 [Verrucomicrobiota bacterium sgz303538]
METGSGFRRARSVYIEYLEKRIAPATFIVTNLNDSGVGSLRQAVLNANASPGADTIVFKAAAVSGEIALTSGEIDITDSVIIKGPGAAKLAIDALDLSRIFNIDDGTAAVKKVTISGLSMLAGNSGTVEGGGGVHCLESITLVNSVVSGCRAPGSPTSAPYGGGLYIVTDGQAIIRNSKITGNVSGRGAGGIFVRAEGGIQIINTVISANSSVGLGGGVYAHVHPNGTGDILITGSTITNNTAGLGGGLNIDNDPPATGRKAGTITIRDTLISGNSATVELPGNRPSEGGGLYFDDGIVTIDHCTITNNVAKDHGGGLSTDKITSLTIRNSTVANNGTTSAIGAGGGVYIDGAGENTRILSTLVSNNASSGTGGGVFALNSQLTVQKSTISGNTSVTDGGGIYVKQGALSLDRTTVRDNRAGAYGGGISAMGVGAEKTDVRITNSLFTANRAAFGGGADAQGDGSVAVISSRFLQNVVTDGDGGGLYLRSNTGTISIVSSLIAQNTVADDGGGVALRGGATPITITNTVVSDNIAGDTGGGIALFGGTLRIATSTVIDNIAARQGGGIWSQSNIPIAITGSKVTGNIAPIGPQIYEPPPT